MFLKGVGVEPRLFTLKVAGVAVTSLLLRHVHPAIDRNLSLCHVGNIP